MGQSLNLQIANELKSLEQGEFQSFCLDFLPLFDPIYDGLERHGHTADGKTRKGTPDLIKTLPNGKQIAVQCSIEDTYWKSPGDKSKLSSWKPCEDIDKCMQKLSDVQEIVLCSSQEIPTNAPNAKAEVLAYAILKSITDGIIINSELLNNSKFLTPGIMQFIMCVSIKIRLMPKLRCCVAQILKNLFPRTLAMLFLNRS